ncbi:MAG: WYL domain-containing protein, partial [Evtepia sp.]|nr:WYL domain-containing protein [Evtepia sp.]
MGKAHSDQRDRTLSLIRLLYQESDEDHPFTTQQIVQRLTQAGISAERKSVYRDLAAMNQHGFPVAYRRGAGWYAAGQPFTLA